MQPLTLSQRKYVGLHLILCAFLFLLPFFLSAYLNQGHYSPFSVSEGVSPIVYDETHHYAVGPSRFFKLGRVFWEGDVFEYQNRRNVSGVFHSVLIGSLARVFNSLEWAWVVCVPLFVCLSWFFLFCFSRLLTLDFGSAIFASWATLLIPFGVQNFFLLGENAWTQPLEIGRSPYPLLAFPFFLATLLSFSYACQKQSFSATLLSGVFLGSQCYLYYFNTVSLFLGAILLLLIFAVQSEKKKFWVMFRIVGLALLCAIPFAIAFWVGKSEGQTHLFYRAATPVRQFQWFCLLIPVFATCLLIRHQRAILSITGFLAFCCFGRLELLKHEWLGFSVLALGLFVFAWAKRSPKWLSFQGRFSGWLWVGVCGASWGYCLHAVTGWDVQKDHYLIRIAIPLTFFLLVNLLCQLRLRPILMKTGLVCILCLACFRQAVVSLNTFQEHSTQTPRRQVLAWISTNLDATDVLATSDREIVSLIPTVTGNWSFVPAGLRTMASNEEILTRYLIASQLEGRTKIETIDRFLDVSPEQKNWLKPYFIFLSVTRIEKDKMHSRLSRLWDEIELAEEVSHRRLDYFILPRQAPMISLQELFPRVTQVYSNEHWKVVRIL